ncbi:MAG: N-acetylmuramoyl-L-alanine amidase [Chitinophagaceae bacterium]|nr:N-acetylmuramoyl-L-alanine amidase [Chitinophagaceae bacterium]
MNKLQKLLALSFLVISSSFTNLPPKSIVVIDASHGGKDNGAVINGVKEKDITLAIAKKIIASNKRTDIKIILLRDKDETILNPDRAKKIRELKPKLIISLHANYSPKDESKHGVEFVVSKQSNFYQASLVQTNKMLPLFMNAENPKPTIVEQNLQLIISAPCPSIVIELGYMSNKPDLENMKSRKGQEEIAKKIVAYMAQ